MVIGKDKRLVELVIRLRALMAEATPLGWFVERDEYEGFISHADARFPTLFRPGVNNDRSRQDARLVVEAVNALPELLAVVEACIASETTAGTAGSWSGDGPDGHEVGDGGES